MEEVEKETLKKRGHPLKEASHRCHHPADVLKCNVFVGEVDSSENDSFTRWPLEMWLNVFAGTGTQVRLDLQRHGHGFDFTPRKLGGDINLIDASRPPMFSSFGSLCDIFVGVV